MSRRVVHFVSLTKATVLERMIQAQPMSNLVRRGSTEVVVWRTAARQRRVQNDDPVHRGVSFHFKWKRCPTEQTTSRLRRVEVQSRCRRDRLVLCLALPLARRGVPHLEEISVVDHSRLILLETEANPVRSVGVVQHLDLIGALLRGYATAGTVDNVDKDDWNRDVSGGFRDC